MSIELILADHPIRAVEALAHDLQAHPPSDPFEPQVVWLTDPSLEGWVKTWIAHHAGIAANLRFVPLREGLLGAWAVDGEPLQEPSVAELAGEVLGVWRSSPESVESLAIMLDKGLSSDRSAREAALSMQVGEWLSNRFWEGCASDAQDETSQVALKPWLADTLHAVRDPRSAVPGENPRPHGSKHCHILASRPLTAREWQMLDTLDAHSTTRFVVGQAVFDPSRWIADAPFPEGSATERLLAAETRAARPPATVAVRTHGHSTWNRTETATPAHVALQHIQAALRHAGPNTPPDGHDLFLPAWSPRREVEQLRDRLLTRFSKTAASQGHRLEPRDVLILTPDMATYGPLIANIFSAEPALEQAWVDPKNGKKTTRLPAIPTSLAGLGLTQLNPVARALLDVLTIAADRLTAPVFHRLATTPVVQAAFSIPKDAGEDLEALLRESRAAWGFDAEDKEQVYGPPLHGASLHPNSFDFSTQRLALSAFVHDESEAGTTSTVLDAHPLRPLSLASRERTQLAGALGRLTGTLRASRDALNGLATASAHAWNAELKTLVHRYTHTGATTAFLTKSVEDAIDEAIPVREDVALDLEGVRRLLRNRFDLPVSVKGDFGGVVRVQPLRAGPIPIRPIVVFLGMGSGAWPRRPRRPEWWPPSQGPSIIERQRQAFAEAIAYAHGEVWLSYPARELSKGQEQPPSALVQEVEDLFRPDEVTREAWRTPRGRQAWSETAPATFARETQAARRAVRDRDPSSSGGAPIHATLDAVPDTGEGLVTEVKAADLVSTLLNPSKAFLYGRLGVYLPEDQEELSEREPLAANHLDRYTLKVRAFDWLQQQGTPGTPSEHDVQRCVDALVAAAQGTGSLSLGDVPHLEVRDCVQAAADTLAMVEGLEGQTQRDVLYSIHMVHEGRPMALSITVPFVKVQTTDDGTQRHLHVWPRYSSSAQRPRLSAWLGYWIAHGLGKPVEATTIGTDKPDEWFVPLPDAASDPAPTAAAVLSRVLSLSAAAHRRPLHLFKKSSMALVEKVTVRPTPSDVDQLPKLRAQAQSVVATEWFYSKFNQHPDEHDRWIAALHSTLNPAEAAERSEHLLTVLEQLPDPLGATADVVSTSRLLWEPLLRTRTTNRSLNKFQVNGFSIKSWTQQ